MISLRPGREHRVRVAVALAGLVPLAGYLALFAVPVRYTLHLGEVNIILAALVGTDLLRYRDGGWWQGIATGLAAGIKLTPLIFVVYLLVTGRIRAGLTAAGTFAATVAGGYALLPRQSRAFWLSGLFLDERRIANPASPSDQSLSDLVARHAGNPALARPWWLAAALLTGLAGIMIAAWAHGLAVLAGAALVLAAERTAEAGPAVRLLPGRIRPGTPL